MPFVARARSWSLLAAVAVLAAAPAAAAAETLTDRAHGAVLVPRLAVVDSPAVELPRGDVRRLAVVDVPPVELPRVAGEDIPPVEPPPVEPPPVEPPPVEPPPGGSVEIPPVELPPGGSVDLPPVGGVDAPPVAAPPVAAPPPVGRVEPRPAAHVDAAGAEAPRAGASAPDAERPRAGATPRADRPPPSRAPGARGRRVEHRGAGEHRSPARRRIAVPDPGATASRPAAEPASAPRATAGRPAAGGALIDDILAAVRPAAADAGFPLLLLLAGAAFLLAQHRIDRRDPKLAGSPLTADAGLSFKPPPQP